MFNNLDKVNHFVIKKEILVLCDTCHMTLDMWHLTHDTGQVGSGEPSLRFLAPLLLQFESEVILKIFSQRMT